MWQKYFFPPSSLLSKVLSPVILKSLFLLPPIRGRHAEWGGGERERGRAISISLLTTQGSSLERPAAQRLGVVVGTTSDTPSEPSASTPWEGNAAIRRREELSTASPDSPSQHKVSRCRSATTASSWNNFLWAGLLNPLIELCVCVFSKQSKDLRRHLIHKDQIYVFTLEPIQINKCNPQENTSV